MKNSTIVIVTLAVAVAAILSLAYASSAVGSPIASTGQSRSGYGMMGGYGGMMGAYNGGTYSGTGYGGMMGGYGNGAAGYMWNMMYNTYGNLTSWCNQFMSHVFGQGYPQS